jgi:hypothetical protein
VDKGASSTVEKDNDGKRKSSKTKKDKFVEMIISFSVYILV